MYDMLCYVTPWQETLATSILQSVSDIIIISILHSGQSQEVVLATGYNI